MQPQFDTGTLVLPPSNNERDAMRLNFLAAGLPLTKSFSRLPSGEIEKSAYPLVRNFTSYEEQIADPAAFHESIVRHAELGHCLSKGVLRKALSEESRAGSTSPLDPTSWSCFDLDNVRDVADPEAFIQQVLPPAFHHVDYVLQYSASAGFSKDLRAHIFFLHDTAVIPEVAKLFLTELNLTHPILFEQLELTASGTALRFPLDRTIMQNDKLIYIAPPILASGIADPLGHPRISLVVKGIERVSFDWKTKHAPAGIENATQSMINKLREKAGLRKKTAKVVVHSGELLLKNPDVAIVTGEKRARGFTYLNINGGDSWAYYYSDSHPRFLRNFKGEPMVVLKDFVPAYYAQVAQRLNESRQSKILVPFAFRHRPTDTIYNGVYDTVNDCIYDLAACSKQSLIDFFAQYDEDVPRIDDWRYEFEPNNPIRIDFKNKFCNRYEPTEYLRETRTVATIPPMIDRVLKSVVGDDLVCYHHLINWLAFIVQKREKTMTGWVLHGVQGTGKGVLFHRIMTPILGKAHCLIKQVGALDDRFNVEMQTCLLFLLDESEADSTPAGKRAVARIKNMISEPEIEVRAMRTDARQVRSYSNHFFFSNQVDAYAIEATDRRLNVAPRQETPLKLTLEDLAQIDAERGDFAAYLVGYKVNEKAAHEALDNEAKALMRDASQDALEQMCQAVMDGNLAYFMQYADGEIPANVSLLNWSNYIALMKRWVTNTEKPSVLRSEDMMAAYMYLLAPPQPPGVHKFIRMLAHKNLMSKVHHCPTQGKKVRGFKTHWQASAEDLESWRAMLAPRGEKQPHARLATLPECKQANK